jgi:nicotinate phosphoribosyltransferase
VFRLFDDTSMARLDIMTLEDEVPQAGVELIAHHPSGDYRRLAIKPAKVEPILHEVMRGGEKAKTLPGIKESQQYLAHRLEHFDGTYLRLLNPHIYKVSVTERLKDLKLGLIKKYLRSH